MILKQWVKHMFRYSYFNKKDYKKDIIPVGEKPKGWVNVREIRFIFFSAWEEHCLECSVPECYGNCKVWEERLDKKCKKTVYGLKRRKDLIGKYPFAVQLKFRPWGKMESHVGKRTFSPDRLRTIDFINFTADRLFLYISILCKPIFPSCKPSGFEEFVKNRLVLSGCREDMEPSHFLLQCFSDTDLEYKIQIEMTDKEIFLRKSLEIRKGYNQLCIDLSGYEMGKRKNILVCYYP